MLFYENPYKVKLDSRLSSKSIIKDIKNHISKHPSEFIYNITNYELINTDKNCGGYFSSYDKQIAINKKETDVISILLHELGHFYQLYSGIDIVKDYTLSHQINIEQQCDAFSLLMHKEIFNIDLPKRHWAYFDKESYIFLANWYKQWPGCYEIDIELCQQ